LVVFLGFSGMLVCIIIRTFAFKSMEAVLIYIRNHCCVCCDKVWKKTDYLGDKKIMINHRIIIIGVIILFIVASFSGCTYLCEKKSDAFYETKIAEYFSDGNWPDDYIVLENWDGDCREFTIYSYNPEEYYPYTDIQIFGGWASGYIDICGDISDVFYS